MKEQDLVRILAMMQLEAPKFNASGWGHIACPLAPFLHKNGVDRSKGFAIKVEDDGVSAFSCPVCKNKGRIANLASLLGRYRGIDYTAVEAESNKIEMLRMSHIPPWEERSANQRVETLGDPLDEIDYAPDLLFDDVREHPAAVTYLRSRRVNGAAVDKAGICFDPDTQRIVFPVRDGAGGLHGFTGRTIIPDHNPKVKDYLNLPKRMLILGEERWEEGKPIALVEGLIGYARFLSEGIDEHFNVGAILGSVITPGKANILRRQYSPLYLWLDPDEAGRGGIFGPMKKVGTNFDGTDKFEQDIESGAIWLLAEHMPVFVPTYPEGIFDVDDLTLNDVLTQSQGLYPYGKPKLKKKVPEKKVPKSPFS